MVNGYANAEPGFQQNVAVMNLCSELIVGLNGADAGEHARTAIVPPQRPVVISAEVKINPPKPWSTLIRATA
jgi:hypothetical protein